MIMYDYNWNLSWDSIKNPFVIKLHNLVVYLFLCCPIFRLAFTHVHFLSARSERLRRSYWSLNSKVDIKNMVWKPTLYAVSAKKRYETLKRFLTFENVNFPSFKVDLQLTNFSAFPSYRKLETIRYHSESGFA